MTPITQTEYGKATLNKNGYLVLTKNEKGKSRFLHRRVFEEFYQIKLPKNIVIHHNDGNRLNNEIWNLIPMTNNEHCILHHKGIKLSNETKKRISEGNKGKKLSEEHKQLLRKINKGKKLSESTRKKLSENHAGEKNYWYGKKISEGHRQKIRDAHKGKNLSEEHKQKIKEANIGKLHSIESKLKMSKNKNKSGIYNVFKLLNNNCKQGFTWAYYYYDENNKRRVLSCVNLNKLKEKVLARGLEWIEFVED